MSLLEYLSQMAQGNVVDRRGQLPVLSPLGQNMQDNARYVKTNREFQVTQNPQVQDTRSRRRVGNIQNARPRTRLQNPAINGEAPMVALQGQAYAPSILTQPANNYRLR